MLNSRYLRERINRLKSLIYNSRKITKSIILCFIYLILISLLFYFRNLTSNESTLMHSRERNVPSKKLKPMITRLNLSCLMK